jgi:hypothetical protein
MHPVTTRDPDVGYNRYGMNLGYGACGTIVQFLFTV